MNLKDSIREFVELQYGLKSPKEIGVYGDLMLDVYEQVSVNRLSPEFPIPVLAKTSTQPIVRPGGAGNVCEQLRHFNSNVNLISFLNTSAWETLNGRFGLDSSLLKPAKVPIKQRYYDGDFPLCRIDDESPNYGLEETDRLSLLASFETFVEQKNPNLVILSDYGKGVFDEETSRIAVQACHDHNVRTIVDPKNTISPWKGCWLFKPNLIEAASFLNMSPKEFLTDWPGNIKRIQILADCENVAVTTSGNGVLGLEKDRLFEYRPERKAKDVRSVIGAGDCFAAVLAQALACDLELQAAIAVAFEAGAVYVQKKHNEPVWPHELLAFVEPGMAKILSPAEASRVCKENKNRKIVFTNGCFDILHPGHLSTLEFAKSHGDLLFVALNSDDSIRRLKGSGRPIHDLWARQTMVAAMGCVDFVTSFDENTPAELIAELRPHIIVKGGDYKANEVVGHESCEVVIAPTKPGYSTTKSVEKMRTT